MEQAAWNNLSNAQVSTWPAAQRGVSPPYSANTDFSIAMMGTGVQVIVEDFIAPAGRLTVVKFYFSTG